MTQTTPQDIARAIRIELAALNTPQSHLAAYLELSRASFSHRMLGHIQWRFDELQKVAAFLGVPLTRLLTDDRAAGAA